MKSTRQFELMLTWRNSFVALIIFVLIYLAYGTWANPNFWLTETQRGDHLMKEKRYADAVKIYQDPWHIGVAQYRNGDFKEAVQTFARVPGADGAFDRGNALLMHGAYDEAIASYQRALSFRPGWTAAQENMALAQARQKAIDDAGKNRDQESAGAYKPDETAFDQKGDDKNSKPVDMNEQQLSDESLRATWLRRVQTTPGDFLRAKFAYQAAHQSQDQASGDAANQDASQ